METTICTQLGILTNLIKVPFVGNLANRLVNRYTASGIIVLIMQLETMDIMPKGISKQIDGLPINEIAIWLTLAVGIWLIWHFPKPKSKLDKIKLQIELTKAELELEQVKKELEKCKE